MAYDPELQAMSQVFEALKHLENEQRRRIITWVKDRLENTEPVPYTGPVPTNDAPLAAVPVAIPAETPPKDRHDLSRFDTVLDLFAESTVKKATSKILLMAAYLQERHNYKEISSYDVNFRLKRIGHGVTNISSLINGILNKKPPLMMMIGGETHKKQARRKFSVTVEGIKVAKSYLRD